MFDPLESFFERYNIPHRNPDTVAFFTETTNLLCEVLDVPPPRTIKVLDTFSSIYDEFTSGATDCYLDNSLGIRYFPGTDEYWFLPTMLHEVTHLRHLTPLSRIERRRLMVDSTGHNAEFYSLLAETWKATGYPDAEDIRRNILFEYHYSSDRSAQEVIYDAGRELGIQWNNAEARSVRNNEDAMYFADINLTLLREIADTMTISKGD